uniref:Uncharacterized protein n=1 Tax=Anguilla anguilla TaxID=7936 RepID=A0A0E9RZ12_ANGAN
MFTIAPSAVQSTLVMLLRFLARRRQLTDVERISECCFRNHLRNI